ncbi:hypothetical protein [Streptomyces albipurpureus]|uniref:Uncharacterized protein n=1 Tax=Streptomyces albipurpureus TaxID=2897419 RepID=A0ABT0USZ7_9ACTN|nr:hypothetical protein [Streptomyces sp. CWNU-1]MCM2391722.1 hypothetical protein [Streptomyces sp. CWNU-1]
MKRLVAYLNDLSIRLYVRLQTLAAMEPVRLRAALTALILAGAFIFPSLAAPALAERLVAIGVIALPILMGESTRRKVTPSE